MFEAKCLGLVPSSFPDSSAIFFRGLDMAKSSICFYFFFFENKGKGVTEISNVFTCEMSNSSTL